MESNEIMEQIIILQNQLKQGREALLQKIEYEKKSNTEIKLSIDTQIIQLQNVKLSYNAKEDKMRNLNKTIENAESLLKTLTENSSKLSLALDNELNKFS